MLEGVYGFEGAHGVMDTVQRIGRIRWLRYMNKLLNVENV